MSKAEEILLKYFSYEYIHGEGRWMKEGIESAMKEFAELAFNESRLTHPMIGFKHKDFQEFLKSEI